MTQQTLQTEPIAAAAVPAAPEDPGGEWEAAGAKMPVAHALEQSRAWARGERNWWLEGEHWQQCAVTLAAQVMCGRRLIAFYQAEHSLAVRVLRAQVAGVQALIRNAEDDDTVSVANLRRALSGAASGGGEVPR